MCFGNNSINVLIVSHVNPILRSAGNEIRIYKMIKWLRGEGANVILLLNNPPLSYELRLQILDLVNAVYTHNEFNLVRIKDIIPRRIKDIKRNIFQRAKQGEKESEKVRKYLCSKQLIKASKVLCKRHKIDFIIAEYVFTTPCLRNAPKGILKLVDTHDLLSKRDTEESIYCTEEEEREYLLNADVVIGIQKEESLNFKRLVPERKVITVGIDYEIAQNVTVNKHSKNKILIVGSNYPNNVSGLIDFCENAWPFVYAAKPDAELLIVGSIGKGISLKIPQIKILGWQNDLEAFYRECPIVINPTLKGTGLKIKTVEALCHGKALVATSNAVEGLDFAEVRPCLVYDNWKEFAKGIVFLLENEEERICMEESAIRFAKQKFRSNEVYSELAAVLKKENLSYN
jgi:glycosyltransferase involved in cell wall biosynthesis